MIFQPAMLVYRRVHNPVEKFQRPNFPEQKTAQHLPAKIQEKWNDGFGDLLAGSSHDLIQW